MLQECSTYTRTRTHNHAIKSSILNIEVYALTICSNVLYIIAV